MFKNYLVVASKEDTAGMNIARQLNQFGKFDFYITEKSILHEENFDLEKINSYDFIIFASKHSSKSEKKTLSIHSPGNWREAELGGKRGRVCKSSALFQKELFENLEKFRKEHGLGNYESTLEVTHHGPLIDKPCVFIEIGSNVSQWQDKSAGFVVAKTIHETIKQFQGNPYREVAVGIGGPHYCPNFNKIQLNSNFAVSHIIPQYSVPITEEMINHAIEKTEEDVDFVLVDWKGLKNSKIRQEIIDVLERNYVQWKKTSDVDKG